MNTGIQRSSATPFGAWTTTSPVGSGTVGKSQPRKDMTRVMAAHGAPYVAQASPHLWKDLMRKVEKALSVDGPSFINVLVPCPRGWRTDVELGIGLCEVAVDTCIWPLYEVEDGRWRLNHKPRVKKPCVDWLKLQGRFDHLLRPENAGALAGQQGQIDDAWESLLAQCNAPQRGA